MFNSLGKLRLYIIAVLLAFGGFLWAGLTGTRLLGDDNESTEKVNGSGPRGRSHGSHSGFYHK